MLLVRRESNSSQPESLGGRVDVDNAQEEEEEVVIDDDEEENNNNNHKEDRDKVGQISPLVSAYAARLGSEADYARYRACKENSSSSSSSSSPTSTSLAEAFYSRLATLQALHSYGYYMNPLAISSLVSQFQQQQQQQALAALQASPSPDHPQQQQHSLLSPHPFPQNSPSSSAASSCSTSPASSSKLRRDPPSAEPSPAKRAKLSSGKRTNKASRKLNFDDYLTSPVSGTIIRELAEGEEIPAVRKGDIDPEFNVVEVTEEAKAELAKIENKIGDFVCRLCREKYDDAFGLAQHRCSMIVHVEYRCPECDKVFNCPANLASHRRWHKPKHQQQVPNGLLTPVKTSVEQDACSCGVCGRSFKKSSTLRKHMQTHHHQMVEEANNNNSSSSKTSPGKSYSIANLLSPSRSPPAPAAKYSCRICQAVFQSGRDLENHCFEQCRPPPKPQPLSCSPTSPVPKPPMPTTLSCPACPQLTFPDLHQLTRHAAKFHLQPRFVGHQSQLPPPPPAVSAAPAASLHRDARIAVLTTICQTSSFCT